MIDLKRGDQVVCLKDKWTLRFGKYEGCLPIANNVYTVTNVIRGRDDDIYINLAEFQRGKPGFTASAFRKVQNQSKFDFRKSSRRCPNMLEVGKIYRNGKGERVRVLAHILSDPLFDSRDMAVVALLGPTLERAVRVYAVTIKTGVRWGGEVTDNVTPSLWGSVINPSDQDKVKAIVRTINAEPLLKPALIAELLRLLPNTLKGSESRALQLIGEVNAL